MISFKGSLFQKEVYISRYYFFSFLFQFPPKAPFSPKFLLGGSNLPPPLHPTSYATDWYINFVAIIEINLHKNNIIFYKKFPFVATNTALWEIQSGSTGLPVQLAPLSPTYKECEIATDVKNGLTNFNAVILRSHF